MAAILANRTTAAELTLLAKINGVRKCTLQHDSLTVLLNIRIRDRDCRKKSLGIRMHWVLEKLLTVSKLNKRSQVHNTNTVTDVLHHGKVVCNKQVSQPTLSLKLLQKVDNLCLDGNVQSRNGLIAYNKIRIYCKCTCNTNTLALSTGKLMRETICVLCLKTNGFQKLNDLGITFFFIGSKTMSINSLCYNIQNFSSRVQGCIWILENHLHSSAKFMSLLCIQILVNFRSIEGYRSIGRIIQMNNSSSEGRFTTSRLSNQTKSLSLINLKGNVINCFQDLFISNIKVFLQVLDIKKYLLFIIFHQSLPPVPSRQASSMLTCDSCRNRYNPACISGKRSLSPYILPQKDIQPEAP